ncbi:D-2-hydroxyglutarate dehydrogenase YdiJ [Thorsellia anophelis]|uniref:D-2-hydroxyglutarate dehydrogenase n=1 Tax=Thorsellia anophelis DSM 18579 TaxID=1123402 RepID=A0A1I0AP74_9GAMM|nr:FAD-binding and (Fe-S)-binding domain-containing protein [Thorsellia anophelis]SES95724.1 FAD/FMN-containing dehydrogenase [Thorsellia anophelis DSM 18579]
MIPLLSATPLTTQSVKKFVQILKDNGFTGDVTTHYADRLTMATDNSVYQLLPEAVIFPKSTADLSLMLQLANTPEFEKLTFTPRGGGTGTNGQSLNQGIIVDLSRYMKRIIEINVDEGWVRVEAGVVKDELNAFLKPYGYFFAPELSTSNRATIGGMINTDASGQGSVVYGKTSDHVLGLRSVLISGELLDTEKMTIELAKKLAENKSFIGQLYATVTSRCIEQRELILEKFPPLNRFLTGYDIKNVLDDNLQYFDMCRILSGSEGTLAFITEAKLNITKIPKVRRLININYDSFDSALRAAPNMLAANALSVETIDSKVLNLAKEDIVWQSVSELVKGIENTDLILGLNMVEFAGDDEDLINRQVENLVSMLKQSMVESTGVLGYKICESVAEIERVYAMRKKAVGLLGNAKGQAKPIAFVEDTCVPPDVLADYILEFRALLDKHGLSYGMFGHVDAGVLHVRPALDLYNPQQELLLNEITEEVVKLTQKYGGLLWGEHGKGYRAQFSPDFFGMELYTELRRIKAAFDPKNRINPGKICTPLAQDEAHLMRIDAQKRATFDRQIPIQTRDRFIGALECNGNGLCFNYDKHSVMCPSMKVSSNRLHSPKGRAGIVREWLRLLSEAGFTPENMDLALKVDNKATWMSRTGISQFRTLVQKIKNQASKEKGEYDFSHEVKASMDGCLSCKACASQCPIKIDVPQFKAQFLHLYHSRYSRPIADHFFAKVEQITPIMAKIPKVINFLMRQSVSSTMTKRILGMTDLPLLSYPTLKQTLKTHPTAFMSVTQLEMLTPKALSQYVLIVQDPFTSFYEADVLCKLVHFIDLLGYKPVLLPFKPNGKAQHVKGMLDKFYNTAKSTASYLNRIAKLNIPMIGIDAALVLCYRDEYHHALGTDRGEFRVQLVQEWLVNLISSAEFEKIKATKIVQNSPQTDTQLPWSLFLHCTEGAKAPNSSSDWQAIFKQFGQELVTVQTGCCGMAGTYGHEVVNSHTTKALFNLSWAIELDKLDTSRALATGYSCRSQVKRFAELSLKHPIEALITLLEKNRT